MVFGTLGTLSLVNSIIQFVDYAQRLFQNAEELYHSAHGALAKNEELESISRDLSELADGLIPVDPTSTNAGFSKNEQSLCALSSRCKQAADRLVQMLQAVKVKGKHKKWESFHQALKYAWKEKDIKAEKDRVNLLRDEVSLRLINFMK